MDGHSTFEQRKELLSRTKSPFYFSDKNVHFKVGKIPIYIERYDNNMEIGYNVTLENFEDNT